MEEKTMDKGGLTEAGMSPGKMPDGKWDDRWKKKEERIKSFQPTGDIIQDAKAYYDLIGLRYVGSHIGELLENNDEEGMADQLEYSAGVSEKSGFEDIDHYLDVSRQVMRSILDAYEAQDKKKFSVDMVSSDGWEDFKKLRLEALKNYPQAFGVSYEEEVAKSDEYWQKKIASYHKNESTFSVSRMLVAKDKDSDGLVGMGGFFRKAPAAVMVSELYVKKEFQGQGIGESLLKNIIKEAEKDGRFNQIELIVNKSQKEAINLYEKLGFKVTGQAGDEGVNLKDSFLMARRLDNFAKAV